MIASWSRRSALALACAGAALLAACGSGSVVSDLTPTRFISVGDGWMLLIPRRQEHFEDISLSAISFGGALYTRHQPQAERVRAAGPLQVLAHVGFATPT